MIVDDMDGIVETFPDRIRPRPLGHPLEAGEPQSTVGRRESALVPQQNCYCSTNDPESRVTAPQEPESHEYSRMASSRTSATRGMAEL